MSDGRPSVDRLWQYPYVVVRVGCHLCPRTGSYRLARLAAKFGAEASLGAVLDGLALDCAWRRGPGDRRAGKYEAKCGAYFPDLHGPPRPPDLPPAAMRLRVVRGGRRDD